jgi:hypothetical protein
MYYVYVELSDFARGARKINQNFCLLPLWRYFYSNNIFSYLGHINQNLGILKAIFELVENAFSPITLIFVVVKYM